MDYKAGDRIGAAISVKNGKVLWLGEGVYEGDFHPPGTILLTLEEARSYAATDEVAKTISDEELKKRVDRFNDSPMVKNPRIKLDNGETVWGKECWWGTAEGFKKKYAGLTFVNVKIERDKDGFFSRLVGEDGKEVPLNEA